MTTTTENTFSTDEALAIANTAKKQIGLRNLFAVAATRFTCTQPEAGVVRLSFLTRNCGSRNRHVFVDYNGGLDLYTVSGVNVSRRGVNITETVKYEESHLFAADLGIATVAAADAKN